MDYDTVKRINYREAPSTTMSCATCKDSRLDGYGWIICVRFVNEGQGLFHVAPLRVCDLYEKSVDIDPPAPKRRYDIDPEFEWRLEEENRGWDFEKDDNADWM